MRSLMGGRRARRRALSFCGIVADVAVLMFGIASIERSPTRLALERELAAARQATSGTAHHLPALGGAHLAHVTIPAASSTDEAAGPVEDSPTLT